MIMKVFTRLFFLFLLVAITALACKTDASSKSGEENVLSEEDADRLLPFSTGKINNLYVYLDPSYQKGPFRDSLVYYFDQPYLLTPTPSPVLDLTPYDFARFADGSARTANNLVVVNLEEDSEISRFVRQQLGASQIEKAMA